MEVLYVQNSLKAMSVRNTQNLSCSKIYIILYTKLTLKIHKSFEQLLAVCNYKDS